AEHLHRVGQAVGEAVRRLEEDAGALLGAQCAQPLFAGPGLAGREAVETEPLHRQPRQRQRRGHRGRPGQAGERQVAFDAGGDQAIAGIGHRGHARVGHQQHRAARLDVVEQRGDARGLDMVVEADHPARDLHPERLGQGAGAAGVLGGHHVGGGQRRAQAPGGVADVAHRGRGQDQAPARRSGRGLLGGHRAPSGRLHRCRPSLIGRFHLPPGVPNTIGSVTQVTDRPTTPGAAATIWSSPAPLRPSPDFGPVDTLRGWVVTAVLTALAAVTRFSVLNYPTDGGTPVFDEKHYAPQAWQMLTGGGVEDNPGYGLVVHPPVGKQMIAFGELLFGYNGWGWRFSAALAGTVLVLLVVRIVRRMTRSTLVGAIAGILMLADGVLYVSSRIGMLDIFMALFVTA